MENTITFNYMPYIYFESYKNVLNNVREYYPTADIFIYMDSFRDDIEKYRKISDEHKCKLIIRDNHIFYTNREDSLEINKPKLIEVFDRIKYTCENTYSEWLMILEDDVLIKKQIENWPKADVGTCRDYRRPGGGSVFKRNTFLNSLAVADVTDIITTTPDANWAADVVLENIFLRNAATFEEWKELAEPNYRDKHPHSVYHGYKDLYKLG
jgi:hypothetical protein